MLIKYQVSASSGTVGEKKSVGNKKVSAWDNIYNMSRGVGLLEHNVVMLCHFYPEVKYGELKCSSHFKNISCKKVNKNNI